MKIRTIDELLQRLADERIWRVREISSLWNHCRSPHLSGPEARALRRSFIPIAYAHWEGFVKKSAHYYLEYVAMQRPSLGELTFPLMGLYLHKKCGGASNDNMLFAANICEEILNRWSDRIHIHHRDAIPTRSNLDTNVLRHICTLLCLNYEEFHTKEIFINNRLVAKRNHIAHGEMQDIDLQDLEDIKETVAELIEKFKTEIENAAINSFYKR